ncbi:DNA methyltransferase [Nitrobacter sp. 62-23]|uniref:site-specific DNA-methyltransferase n=1 Tax=unclassified Nitrobacter TaxID=2620411 RepID=UPI000B13C40B|nr:ParB N-terminal domain-containing protein [Nitrobacter sp.]
MRKRKIIADILPFQHPAITHAALSDLKLPDLRLRTHNRESRRKLAAILRTVGFIDPVVVDENNNVLAGILRCEVAGELGLETVPILQIYHLNEIEKRTYILAANRLAEDAGWDRDLLAIELGQLAIALPEAGIELETTGFSINDLDQIISDRSDPSPDPLEPELPGAGRPVTRPGDLWICNRSRVHCADALQPASYVTLMAGHRATMTFTDPPYNVSIRKHARGLGRSKHREFAVASGGLSDAEFLRFLQTIFDLIVSVSIDGSIVFSCIDWAHVRIMLDAGTNVFSELKNICVWVKSNGGMGTFYRSRHELVCAFKVGTAPHINTFELGQYGRARTNVWEYTGLNAFKSGRDDELAMHPTVKPVRMIADAMLDCSKPQSIVLDPFLGSGSTLLAGEMVGRHVYGLEIDAEYIDVSIRRWQAFTHRDAILESTGQTFEEVEAERNSPITQPPKKIPASRPGACHG